jgi:hypothetical protein
LLTLEASPGLFNLRRISEETGVWDVIFWGGEGTRKAAKRFKHGIEYAA